MKNKLYLLFALAINYGQAQVKTITVIDKGSKIVIEDVNIISLNIGTVTNSEGKANIKINENESITFSNINYEQKIIQSNDLKTIDTIVLTPRINNLDEVIVNTFNIDNAIGFILNNYNDLYVDKPFEKNCEFKEKFGNWKQKEKKTLKNIGKKEKR